MKSMVSMYIHIYIYICVYNIIHNIYIYMIYAYTYRNRNCRMGFLARVPGRFFWTWGW